MSGGLVSVLMPAYNHERHVETAMRSVLDQTYADVELIVVDDGSADSTWEIARSVADERTTVLTHDGHVNRGLHETLRRALAEATGDWVAGLASDDVMWPHRLERQVATGADMSYGRARLIDQDGVATGEEWGAPPAAGRTPLTQLLVSNVVPVPTSLVRRGVLDRAGGFLGNEVFEDLDLFLRVFAITERVAYLDECLADYRLSSTGIAATVTSAGQDRAAYASAVAHLASWPGLPEHHRAIVGSACRAWGALLALEDGDAVPPLIADEQELLAAIRAAHLPGGAVEPTEARPSRWRRLLKR